jgi:hypothetical protein
MASLSDSLQRHAGVALALVCLVAFAAATPALYSRPRPQVALEMQVALPRFVQVLMAFGDRYLAANLAGFRALVASTENMGPENYRIQGIVQSDAAWLNPAHEDNYYIAAAILPWNGEVAAAQRVLHAATAARAFDWQPPFYLGFNTLHFEKNPAAGAEWLRVAARQTDDQMMQIQLQQVAAGWVAKGEDLEFAIRMHHAMARETQHKAFAAFLEKRALRLENLLALERARDRYRQRFGASPKQVAQLVAGGIIDSLPVDPFGAAYVIDAAGRPQPAAASSSAITMKQPTP